LSPEARAISGGLRKDGEALIAASGLSATILRPWYVLGPAHRWPYALLPIYKLMEILPWTRESAQRLGLVSLHQMVLLWLRQSRARSTV
jgi:uncharacterized protein YbjT (DUF2867 family)